MSKRSAFNSDIVQTETGYMIFGWSVLLQILRKQVAFSFAVIMLDFKHGTYHWLLLNDFLSPRPPM